MKGVFMTYPFWQRIRRWFLRLEDNALPLAVVVLFTLLTGLLTLFLQGVVSWLSSFPSPGEASGLPALVLVVRNFFITFLLIQAVFLPVSIPLGLLLWNLSERLGWWLQEWLERDERDF
jgi:hypothetical protein